MIGLCGGLTFIYGALAVGGLEDGIVPAAFAFLIHLAREIVKDVEDIAGDRRAGAKTLPIVTSERGAQQVAAVVSTVLILLTPIPYLMGLLGGWYLTVVVATVDIPLVWVVVMLFKGQDRAGLRRLSIVQKAVMVTGLAALFCG